MTAWPAKQQKYDGNNRSKSGVTTTMIRKGEAKDGKSSLPDLLSKQEREGGGSVEGEEKEGEKVVFGNRRERYAGSVGLDCMAGIPVIVGTRSYVFVVSICVCSLHYVSIPLIPWVEMHSNARGGGGRERVRMVYLVRSVRMLGRVRRISLSRTGSRSA